MKKSVKLLMCFLVLSLTTIANANPKTNVSSKNLKLFPITSKIISPYFPTSTISYYYVSYSIPTGPLLKIYFYFYEYTNGSLVSANAPQLITITFSDARYGDTGTISEGASEGGGEYVTSDNADITAVSPTSINGIPVDYEEN